MKAEIMASCSGFALLVVFAMSSFVMVAQTRYPIVDTGQRTYFSNTNTIPEPNVGDPFYGQDASYQENMPAYRDNGDGTITDLVTGLMWQKDMGGKISYRDARIKADTMTLGGHNNWRVPTAKELYSLILFTGKVMGEHAINEFIDTTD